MVRCPPAMTAHPSQPKPATRKPRQAKGPNVAEREYRDKYLGTYAMYEAITFRLPGDHRYTPDWVCVMTLGNLSLLSCHEVKVRFKNGKTHQSYQRARFAFDLAREVYAGTVSFVWAERRDDKGGAWEVES